MVLRALKDQLVLKVQPARKVRSVQIQMFPVLLALRDPLAHREWQVRSGLPVLQARRAILARLATLALMAP